MGNNLKNARRAANAIMSVLERLANAFDFADGAASVLCFVGLFCLALLLALVGFLWHLADPSGVWSWPILGFMFCVGVSWAKPTLQKEANDDPLQALEKVNQQLCFIPDQVELTHRYIATRVQCTLPGTV